MQMDISKMVQVRLDMHNSTFNQYIGLAKNFVTSSRKTQTNFLANQILKSKLNGKNYRSVFTLFIKSSLFILYLVFLCTYISRLQKVLVTNILTLNSLYIPNVCSQIIVLIFQLK